MAEGVDYSFARPSPAGLYAAGKRFAGRYVGPGSGKLLDAAERDALFAAGLDIMLLAEGTADGALGGYNTGVRHGELARAHAEQLGAPWNAAIYFAVDFDVTATQWPLVAQYLRGAAFGVGAPQVGIYGGIRAVEWAARDRVADWFFQTYAWSGGRWFAGNHVEQYLNGQLVAGGDVDLCRSRVDNFGQWRAAGLAPEQQEDDVKAWLAQDSTGIAVVWTGAYDVLWRNIAAIESIAGWNAAGVPGPYAVPSISALGSPAQADVPGPGGGPSHAELVDAAFEGAQKAEQE